MIIEIDKNNSSEYLLRISEIHYSAYSKQHFTSCFNKSKLAEYYSDLISNSDLSLVSIDENHIVNGFIVSGYNVGQGVSKFIKNNKPYLLSVFFKNPSFLIEKITSIIKSKLPKKESPVKLNAFRLMSISVDSKSHSKGIGSALIQEFENILKSRSIKGYGLSVRKENTRAIDFYLKNGFKLEKETADSVYYGKELPNE